MGKLRVLLVDDEPLARDGMRALLERDPTVEIVGESGDGAQAVRDIEALRPDVVLLDVRMPELDGFAVIEAVGEERMPAVIFLTAFDDFAVQAFAVDAVDYVTKPFEDERLHAAIARARRAIATRTPWATRLVVRDRDRVSFIPVQSVEWFEAADYYVRLHGAGRPMLHREPLATLERRLDPARFMRTHRGALINLHLVREVRAGEGEGRLAVMRSGALVPVTRGRRRELEVRLTRLPE